MFPRREQRADNHKRGRSLESGVYSRNKEDDLALFKEVQNKEQEHFLLHSNDDIDDILSAKSRNFLGYKLGESNDLLNAAEGDKNDYDWLVTPPEPPLFSSLDDDDPPVNLARRGRPRSKSVSNSRSPSTEKGYRNRRESASPHRPRPSSQTGNSSRPISSTPPRMRQPSPSRGLSPEPSKLSDVQRSNTPQSRRMSTGSVVRGISPIKSRQANSASPQLQALQENMPGFSSEAPPNLRTSLPDRPASYVRGSSPARKDRRSMSPAASRNIGSSHSNDRDSRSRGQASSKKPTNIVIQQTDTKGPHNMFRPLLSSEPTHHISVAPRNPSITTSSNASSDQGTSGAHNTVAREPSQEELTSDCVKGHYPEVDDKLSVHGDFENKILKGSVGDRHTEIGDPSFGTAVMVMDGKKVYPGADGTPNTVICSKCNHELSLKGLIKEGGIQSCQEYTSLGIENGLVEVLDQPAPIQVTNVEKVADLSQGSYSDLSTAQMREKELTSASQEVINNLQLRRVDDIVSEDSDNSNKLQHNDVMPTSVKGFVVSDPCRGVVEESRIMLEDTKARILTLDKATDANTSQVEVSQSEVTLVDKFISNERDIRSRNTLKCNPKTQKVEEKSLEIDKKTTSTNDENNKKLSSNIVEDPCKGDSLDPLKMEARCNCVIM